MGNTKSYRFSQQTEVYLEHLSKCTGFNERQVIEAAITKLFTETENITKNISIDFKDNLSGINNYQVQKFIEALPKSGYKILYYGNGDTLVIQESD